MRQRTHVMRLVFIGLGLVGLLLAAPFVFLATLGFRGMLADVSDAENRLFGLQFLGIALIPGIPGIIALVLGFRFGRSSSDP